MSTILDRRLADVQPTYEVILQQVCGQWRWSREEIALYRIWALGQLKPGLIYRLLEDPYQPSDISTGRVWAAIALGLLTSGWVAIMLHEIMPIGLYSGIGFMIAFVAIQLWIIGRMFNRGAPGNWSKGASVRNNFTYQREGKDCLLPLLAQDIIESIRRHLPGAEFTVTYLKRDPILWYGHSVAILVWDEIGRKKKPLYIDPESFFEDVYQVH
jgi:hypothetical protein